MKTEITVKVPPGIALGDTTALIDSLGGIAAREMRQHFRQMDAKPSGSDAFFGSAANKSHWWGKMAAETKLKSVTSSSATVAIGNAEFALQLYGGTQRPKNGAANLAIPLLPIVRGVSARDAIPEHGLTFWMSPVKKKKFLVKKGPGNALQLYFVLKKEVTVPANPNALPDMDKLGAKLGAHAEDYISRKMGGGK